MKSRDIQWWDGRDNETLIGSLVVVVAVVVAVAVAMVEVLKNNVDVDVCIGCTPLYDASWGVRGRARVCSRCAIDPVDTHPLAAFARADSW